MGLTLHAVSAGAYVGHVLKVSTVSRMIRRMCRLNKFGLQILQAEAIPS